MLGYTEEEIRKLTFLDLTHEDYRESNWEFITELLEGSEKSFRSRSSIGARMAA